MSAFGTPIDVLDCLWFRFNKGRVLTYGRSSTTIIEMFLVLLWCHQWWCPDWFMSFPDHVYRSDSEGSHPDWLLHNLARWLLNSEGFKYSAMLRFLLNLRLNFSFHRSCWIFLCRVISFDEWHERLLNLFLNLFTRISSFRGHESSETLIHRDLLRWF